MNTNCFVFGSTSCGKSTFINALMQKDICEIGSGETTKERKIMKLGNLNIIDIPGCNGNYYDESYDKDLKNAYAIFLIFGGEGSGADKTTERNFKKILKARGTSNNIYFILNKIDLMYGNGIEQNIKDINNNYNYPTSHIYTISSKYAYLYIKYRDGKLTEEESEFLKDKVRSNVLNDDNMYDIYMKSGIKGLKEKVEELSNKHMNDILKDIIEANNLIPNGIISDMYRRYGIDEERKRKESVSIVSTVIGGTIGLLAGGVITIGSLILFIPTGGLSGAAAITSGLAALGFGGMLGGVATAGAISVAGATSGLVAGSVVGNISSKVMTNYAFSKDRYLSITQEDLKFIKQIYSKNYLKDMNKLKKYLPDQYINNNYQEYMDKTIVFMNDTIYSVDIVYKVIDKKIKVSEIRGYHKLIVN